MEIEAGSWMRASTGIPKIDRKELGRALPENKPNGSTDCRAAVHFIPLIMNRRFNAVTLLQATEASPALASLASRARDANDRLAAIEDLIPAELRPSVKAGPAEGDAWSLLVAGNAAAAKLRQLTPAFLARLQERGWRVDTLRIKVRARG
jgi:hypothetical protein